MQALVSFDKLTASWALVKWEEGGRFTVVQVGWVLEPYPVPLRKNLPAKSLGRWTKRSASTQSLCLMCQVSLELYATILTYLFSTVTYNICVFFLTYLVDLLGTVLSLQTVSIIYSNES